ncbi:MAG TPA: serine hydrolase [Candidatus Deferrimicrobium sp.]|nr:serine hydrolase [Candidatus Deferrimicrobium sp.]
MSEMMTMVKRVAVAKRTKLPRVVLLLVGFVLFSVNTVYFVDTESATPLASVGNSYRFRFDHLRGDAPPLNAKAAMLVNYETGEVLYARNPEAVCPIASISKLVAAMVVLDKGVDLNCRAVVTQQDAFQSSSSRLRVGWEFSLLDLLRTSLMVSDNRATRALARATSGSIVNFVEDMNRKVRQLGLEHTLFFDPTGLDERNVSTAHEVAKILHHAYQYHLIAEITSNERAGIKIQNRKNRYLRFTNTNRLVLSPYKVLAGKTGYICESGHCLATLVANGTNQKLTLVFLGVPGSNLRFRQARRLLGWGFKQLS